MLYVITDIETTGGFAGDHRITEVGICLHDGEKVIDTYHTLVNPERPIPKFVQALTGINDEVIADAPVFEQVAEDIHKFLDGHVFVAHNVSFDFSFIKRELKDCDFDFNPKKLCTVRLSREILPGMPSYSLGKLCSSLGIVNGSRHRALGDATATAELFSLLVKEDSEEFIKYSLNQRNKEATMPPNLDKAIYDALPEEAGVYYLHDSKGKILYIGKAVNIKKRITTHLQSKARKQALMRKDICDISYEVTGNDLIALLYESEEIKKHWPPFNRAQKKQFRNFALYQYEDQNGYIRLRIAEEYQRNGPLKTFANITKAREFVYSLVDKNELCPKLCNLQRTKQQCYHLEKGKCKGACIGQEAVKTYNKRLSSALQESIEASETFVIIGKGRVKGEFSLVAVEKGVYKGFGFCDCAPTFHAFEEVEDFIKARKDNTDTQSIIRMYLTNYAPKVLYFQNQTSL